MDLIPYVPTPEERLATIFKLITIKPGQKAVDLGAGDGRLVIALAKAGATAHGFEIQEKYARRAKMQIAMAGLSDKAFILQTDFWQADLSDYDIIIMYGMVSVMAALAVKLQAECKAGALIVSNGFPLPNWPIQQHKNHIFVYSKQNV